MNMQNRASLTPVQIHVDHVSQKRLGNWTTARAFQVRARHARVTIDLRSPQIPAGDIELSLDLDRSTVKLLVAGNAVIDHWHLAWTGRGKVKQTYHSNPARTGRRIRLTGQVRHGEVRVQSGGIARLSAIASREYFADAHRAHAEGGTPILDDPPDSCHRGERDSRHAPGQAHPAHHRSRRLDPLSLFPSRHHTCTRRRMR